MTTKNFKLNLNYYIPGFIFNLSLRVFIFGLFLSSILLSSCKKEDPVKPDSNNPWKPDTDTLDNGKKDSTKTFINTWESFDKKVGFNQRPVLFKSPTGELYIYEKGHSSFYVSTDNGATWEKVLFKIPSHINFKMQKFDQNNWYILGGDHLYITNNAGEHYKEYSLPDNGHFYGSMYFLNKDIGFLYSSEKEVIYKTSNGGKEWKTILLESVPRGKMNFFNDLGGVVYSNYSNYFYETKDGGNNWQKIEMPSGVKDPIYGLSLLNSNEVFAWSADSLTLYKSNDGGRSYSLVSKIALGEKPSIWGIAGAQIEFLDSNRGILAVAAQIWHTYDGGKTWVQKFQDNIPNGFRIFPFSEILITKDYAYTTNSDFSFNYPLILRLDLNKF